jgi:hypothetical protein
MSLGIALVVIVVLYFLIKSDGFRKAALIVLGLVVLVLRTRQSRERTQAGIRKDPPPIPTSPIEKANACSSPFSRVPQV